MKRQNLYLKFSCLIVTITLLYSVTLFSLRYKKAWTYRYTQPEQWNTLISLAYCKSWSAWHQWDKISLILKRCSFSKATFYISLKSIQEINITSGFKKKKDYMLHRKYSYWWLLWCEWQIMNSMMQLTFSYEMMARKETTQ